MAHFSPEESLKKREGSVQEGKSLVAQNFNWENVFGVVERSLDVEPYFSLIITWESREGEIPAIDIRFDMMFPRILVWISGLFSPAVFIDN
jgi:hypothetical protein